MNDQRLRDTLGELKREQARAIDEYGQARQRLQSLTQAVEGLEGLLAASEEDQPAFSSAGAAPPTELRGQAAIEAVFVATPGKWWTVKALTNELIKRGWAKQSERAQEPVRAALKRIIEKTNAGADSRGLVETSTNTYPIRYRYRTREATT